MAFAKSAKKQYLHPIEANITGTIPEWIKGSLYRNGPALFNVGHDKYNHLFDGLAMIQRYHIEDGKVYFNSQYVHSNSYLRNKASNRIVVSEFGTSAYPDPCRTIFDRIASKFYPDMTDNTSVTVYDVGDEIFTATETNVIHRIDAKELTTLGSVRLSKILSIHRATAHFHKDIQGSGYTYLLGFINNPPQYVLAKLPPIMKADITDYSYDKYEVEKNMEEASIEIKVPARWKFNPSYFHSFALTQNYFILLECPLTLSVLELSKSLLNLASFSDVFKWWPNEYTKIHIIDRKTGKPIDNEYYTNAMFTFHHINAYEHEGHVVIDYCGYDTGDVILNLKLKELNDDAKTAARAYPKRLVVPLNFDPNSTTNLNTLEGVSSTAKLISKNRDVLSVHVTPEILNSASSMELPTINYDHYNGRKYRFSYGVAHNKLIKVDADAKTETVWSPEEEKCSVNEAIFLPDPNADLNNPEDEDFGVLLCPVIFDETSSHDRYQSLYVLDARTLTESGCAEFSEVSIPFTFHGIFKEN